MREQLRKEIVKRTGEYVHSAAAAAAYEEESAKIVSSFDQMVADGKSELEAYRAMLDDIEAMKIVLSTIPEPEDVAERKAREKARKKANKAFRRQVGSMQALLWILTVAWYFLYSFHSGRWATSWLLFLGSSVGSMLLDIVVKHSEGKAWSKCGDWHGIFWVGLVMLYFQTSFLFGNWATSWLLFLVGAGVEVVWDMFQKNKNDPEGK